ncbi:hypothetical protein ACFL0Q_07365 [Thermodesulfobacteriota bacterium]
MKKWIMILSLVFFLGVNLTPAIAANPDFGRQGPAPNSGDGIPDGSGFDGPNGPNGK